MVRLATSPRPCSSTPAGLPMAVHLRFVGEVNHPQSKLCGIDISFDRDGRSKLRGIEPSLKNLIKPESKLSLECLSEGVRPSSRALLESLPPTESFLRGGPA